MSLSLNDKNLMAHFTETVYYPLLNHIPREWIADFEDIILKFDPSETLCMAYATEGSFSINIDLDKMEKMTLEQFREPPKLQRLIVQYFGNLAFAVVRAFYRYNKDIHPENVEGKDVETLTLDFMTNYISRAEKKLKETRAYIT